MKTISLLFLFIIFFYGALIAQPIGTQVTYPTLPTQTVTNANVPTAENVLVVYNSGNSTSVEVKNYYVTKRSIPTYNILGISIPSSFTYSTGTVILDQSGELIKNSGTCSESSTEVCDNIAWQFYKDFIQTPIKNYLNTTYNQNGVLLKDAIRYIVLCKGIPHKIRSGHIWIGTYGEWAHRTRINVSVDALLCLLNNNQDIISLYNNPVTPVQPPVGCGIFCNDVIGGNPYNGIDQNFSFDYRFLPNHFETSNGWKLNYLVSRLDGDNINEVKVIIDKSVDADKSGIGEWIIDDDPDWGTLGTFTQAKDQLVAYGFNVNYNNLENWITTSSNQVMGYTSKGIHASDFDPIHATPTYIQDSLKFSYLNAASFSSWESFNAWGMNRIYRNNQGLISDWVLRRSGDNQSGTMGVGNTWEPFSSGVVDVGKYFPAYAMGYNIVDAAYMGMSFLAWQNIVIGDPLTTIAWGKQTLTQNLTWSGTNLVTGIITVSSGKTLTIDNDAIINLKYQSSIEVQSGGTLVIQPGAEINFFNTNSLVVYGTLDAQGTSSDSIYFNRGGTSGNWGSIIFDGSGSANSILDYVEIKNASDIQCLNNASITIQNSLIQNCTQGIYIYNSAPLITDNQILDPYGNGIYGEANGKAPLIRRNKIKKLTNNLYNYQGIYLGNYTNPFITGNDIQGFDYGIYYGGGGTSWFSDADYITPVTNNRLVNNNTGLCTAWGSYTIAGWHDDGSHNSIYGNTYYDAKAYQYGQIEARFNWWGTDGPQIYAYQGGLINAANVLDYDPWEGIQLRTGDPPMVVSDDIFTGILLERAGRIDETIKHYKQMISRNYTPGFALARLAAIKNKYTVNSIQNYFESLLTVNTGYKLIVLDLLAGIYLGDNNYNQAMQIYNKIIDEYPNSYASVNAKFEKFFATLNYAKNSTIATNILSEIQSLKLAEEEQLMRLEIAEYLLKGVSNSSESLGKSTNPKQEINALSLPKEYSLFQNYPNPFNPHTHIKYSLKEDAIVTLKLFDILGNELATLVNEPKNQGNHSVDFNSSNLSSGVYIYQLKANNYNASKKMIITK